MASVCMPQANYQQHSNTFNAMLLQQQVQQLQQQYPIKQHQQQRIAPAPTKMVLGNSNLQNIQQQQQQINSNFGPMQLQKKKYTYANMPYGEQLPSVARRNARERNRVKQVNNGFANLRQHLPQPVINALSNGGRGASKKLSKVDTLRIAVEYIRGLQDLLDEADSNCSSRNYFDEENSNDLDCDLSYEQQSSQHQFNSFHSEASASPAPSYSDSDISIGGAAHYMQPLKLEADHHQQQQQFKFENFDNHYDDQPDDEELLDYISSWQEQS